MRGEPITLHEANGLLLAASRDSSICGLRDSCVIVLMVAFGLHVRQLVSLNIDDYNRRAGSLLVGMPAPASISLRAPVRSVMNRWIRARGPVAGPLFNNIVRSNYIIPRPLEASDINYLLTRRISEAGLSSFSTSDIARTHSLMACGAWDARPAPEIELFKLMQRRDATTGKIILSAKLNPIFARGPGDDTARLLVRLFSHYTRRRRAVLKRNLDLFAYEVAGSVSDSSALDWCGLTTEMLPSQKSLALRFNKRKVNAITNGFYELLRVGLAIGAFDKPLYDELRTAFGR